MKKLDSIVNFDLMENKAGNTYTNTRKRHETFEQSNARHHNAGINALWVVIILCTVLAYKFYFHKYKITYVPESVAAMIVGIAVGTCLLLIARYSSYVLEFKLEGFYYILLPPIIFKAGFGLEKSQFFGNIGSISIFALFGTLISTLIIGFSLFGLAKLGIVPLDSNHALEALMFGALISSTDPVSTVSIMSSLNTDPMLHALIFGESVLNDAVCITLYKTLEGFHPFFSEKTELVGFEFHDLGKCIIIFLGITLVSIMIGVLFALACSMISNKCPRIQNHPEIEIGMTFFSAYGAYCVGEIAEMSGIMALFFCAIVLAHYHSHNLSKSSKTAVEGTVQALGFFAETAVFVVLGITAVSSIAPASTFQWSVPFVMCALFLCLLSRAVHVVLLSFFLNLGLRQQISKKFQLVMIVAGLRGAVSFALSLEVPEGSSRFFATTTLAIVFITTVVQGSLSGTLISHLGLTEDANVKDKRQRSAKRGGMFCGACEENVMYRVFGGSQKSETENNGGRGTDSSSNASNASSSPQMNKILSRTSIATARAVPCEEVKNYGDNSQESLGNLQQARAIPVAAPSTSRSRQLVIES
uniref:Sodium/hydrogen exchanger n=1 Tax=Amorphochlora amoebiformis TaxID=1561963 RepID=A0A7S0H1C0_9EUKA